jgi:hypothetical protein
MQYYNKFYKLRHKTALKALRKVVSLADVSAEALEHEKIVLFYKRNGIKLT